MALAVGTKSLQDILVDAKVPREEREELLAAAMGEEILWIPGPPAFRQVNRECADASDKLFGTDAARFFPKGRYTQNYKLSSGSKRVLLLTLESLN